MRVTVSKSFAVAWALTLAMLITSLGQAPQPNDPPLDQATVREQATLPPGYTVFSVETAERSVRKNYPFIKRLATDLPDKVTAQPGLITRDTERGQWNSIFSARRGAGHFPQ